MPIEGAVPFRFVDGENLTGRLYGGAGLVLGVVTGRTARGGEKLWRMQCMKCGEEYDVPHSWVVLGKACGCKNCRPVEKKLKDELSNDPYISIAYAVVQQAFIDYEMVIRQLRLERERKNTKSKYFFKLQKQLYDIESFFKSKMYLVYIANTHSKLLSNPDEICRNLKDESDKQMDYIEVTSDGLGHYMVVPDRNFNRNGNMFNYSNLNT